MKRLTLVTAIILLGCLSTVLVYAGLDKVEKKASRGASNMLGCWIEIPYQSVEGLKKNMATGLPVGLGMGIVMTPVRLGTGLIDFLTFPAPLPILGYGPMFEPAINPWLEKPKEQQTSPSPSSFEKAHTKFNRGLANMMLFWIEMPYQLSEGVKANSLTGIPVGLGKSLYMMPARMGSGAVDFLTFPAPFPVEDYGSLVKPPYNPWTINEQELSKEEQPPLPNFADR